MTEWTDVPAPNGKLGVENHKTRHGCNDGKYWGIFSLQDRILILSRTQNVMKFEKN